MRWFEPFTARSAEHLVDASFMRGFLRPLALAVVLGLVAAGLLFLPETFQTMGDTVYQTGAAKNQIQGTTAIGGG